MTSSRPGLHESGTDCDFCSQPDSAAWLYPAADFTSHLSKAVSKTLTLHSKGAWLACDECALYIENGEWPMLAARYMDEHPDVQAYDLTYRALLLVWSLFIDQRTGPRQAIRK